jgi:hypothetical protein
LKIKIKIKIIFKIINIFDDSMLILYNIINATSSAKTKEVLKNKRFLFNKATKKEEIAPLKK